MSLLSSATAKQEALMEFAALGQPDHLPMGMYVFPTEIYRWSGFLSIHRGYYSSAVFHFTVVIPPDYPHSAPQVTWDSPQIFHPLVDPVTGRMRIDSRFPVWRPRQDFIFALLQWLKSSFKRKYLDELREAFCANIEAYRLYREQTSLFAKLAQQSAKLSISSSVLYSATPPSRTTEPNPSPFRFRKLRDEAEKEEMKKEVNKLAMAKIVKP